MSAHDPADLSAAAADQVPVDDLTEQLGFPDPLHVRLPLGEAPTDPEAATAYADRVKAQVELYRAGLDLRETLTKRQLEGTEDRLEIERKRIELAALERRNADDLASAAQSLVYTFYDDVREESVKAAMATIAQWSRRAPGRPIEVVLNSPGGHVTDGLALYDFLQGLRVRGHRITVTAHGMAASMGGVLLQAGDERVISANAFLLIHEVRGGAYGTTSGLEEEVAFFRMLQDRLLHILSERSTMSVDDIKARWERRDWWLTAEQTVELGFADRVG